MQTSEDKIVFKNHSKDGITTKYVQQISDRLVETTYVNRPEKHIICYSSGFGCPLKCQICSAASTWIRNLASDELITQVNQVLIDQQIIADKPILFSAMGVGEPFISVDSRNALLSAMLCIDQNIPLAKHAVSTTAIHPAMISLLPKLQLPRQFKLQISLHACTDEKREVIIGAGASKICEIIKHAIIYDAARPNTLEFNYLLFEYVNDKLDDATGLAKILWPNAKIKINRFNPISSSDLVQSSRVNNFVKWLQDFGLQAEYYETDGADIAAACGQLKAEINIKLQ